MATFFSLYTSIFLLLSLTTINRSDAAALNDVCGGTRQPQRCVTLIQSTVSGSERADLPTLGQDVILAAEGIAGDVKIKAHNLFLSARDPKVKSVYLNCENLYQNTLDGLFSASNFLKQRQFNKVGNVAGIARSGVSGCAAAVANNGGLRQGNDDTGILADALAIVAKKLS